VVMAKYKIKI